MYLFIYCLYRGSFSFGILTSEVVSSFIGDDAEYEKPFENGNRSAKKSRKSKSKTPAKVKKITSSKYGWPLFN